MPLRLAALRFVKSMCRDLAATSGCMPPHCRRGSHCHGMVAVMVAVASHRVVMVGVASHRVVMVVGSHRVVVASHRVVVVMVVGSHRQTGGMVLVVVVGDPRESVASVVV